MTSEEKALKAREILNSNPSDEDMQIAVGLVNEAVADNNATAMLILAQMYYYGTNVEVDKKKSFELCRKTLNGGCERAKMLLAMHYVEGEAVEKDLLMAKTYLGDLMAKDDADAYFFMGNLVLNGTFSDVDVYEGFAYLEKAVSLGNKQAMTRLGWAYASLCETEKSDFWFAKAEAAGVEDVGEQRAVFTEDNYDGRLERAVQFYFSRGKYDKGFRLLERDAANGNIMARYQLAFYSVGGVGDKAYGRNIQRALDLYGQLSAEGEAHADFMLGQIFGEIEDVKDPSKASFYLHKAAEAGHAEAQYCLAFSCCMHSDIAEEKKEGMKWMDIAAEQGQKNALYVLACCYLQDNTVKAGNWQYNPGYGKYAQKGLEYLKRAAGQDQFAALASLAECYYNGKYVGKDYDKAFSLLQRSCSINPHPENVRQLADFYRDGIGTQQNYEEAAKLYQWAIDHNSVQALTELSELYRSGKGVEQNAAKAVELMLRYVEMMEWQQYGKMPLSVALKASAEGDSNAMNQLGDRYENGDGVEQDTNKAVEWWEKASQKGNAMAMYSLGLYHYNKGNFSKALEYMEQAASSGYLPAHVNLGQYYLSSGRDNAEKEKGIAHLTTAAEGGNTDAFHFLCCMYHDGKYVDKDYEKARYWLGKYLATDEPYAHFFLGSSLYHGDMYEQDYAKALEHITLAVKGGCHSATDLYIYMRWYGNNCEQNREEVVLTYTKLAEEGDTNAMHQLYLLYTDETFEGRDEETAMNWLQKAAGQGNSEAIRDLATAYANGHGVKQDIDKALSLYDQAIENGNMNAVYEKACLYIQGVEGVQNPDYGKAIEIIRPYTENDAYACYLMGLSCDRKCGNKDAYSWELATEAAQYMEKAAEGGIDDAMNRMAYWYAEGRGVFHDGDKVKEWLRKYTENAGNSDEANRILHLSDEEFQEYIYDSMFYYWQDIVEANKQGIKDWKDYIDGENKIVCDLLAINAMQLGEANASFYIGSRGLAMLKTAPDQAKRFITLVAEQGYCSIAEQAGKTLLEEGLGNGKAVTEAFEYFNMGAEHGDVGCFLQLGLLCTVEGVSRKVEHIGREYLKQVSELEGDDWEKERRQAKARLEELEQRPRCIVGKIINRLRKLF